MPGFKTVAHSIRKLFPGRVEHLRFVSQQTSVGALSIAGLGLVLYDLTLEGKDRR